MHPAIAAAFEAEVPDPIARNPLLDAIGNAYAAPDRHYHNLRHLDQLIFELQAVRDSVADWNLLMLAAAYHDVVYDTARSDNEAASASRASAELRPWLADARLRKLRDIILATAHHERSDDPDTNLFCDADLAILGADTGAYKRYATQIRQEYARYPDALYNPGRAGVLQKLLDQPALFKSASFNERCEAMARQNISQELASLQNDF